LKHAASLERMALEQDQRIAEVVRREQSRLRNFIRRRVPDPRDAEDILQDVFYKLVEANRLLMPIDLDFPCWFHRSVFAPPCESRPMDTLRRRLQRER
jgi:DNA-directed RNA polymerase specialized sigma24 family protein